MSSPLAAVSLRKSRLSISVSLYFLPSSAWPTLLLVAQNDRTTDSITTLAEIFKKRGVPHRMVVYEPFTPQQPVWAGQVNTAPGHEVFRAQGVHVWERDVLEFLARYLGAASTEAPRGADAAKSPQ